MHPSITLSTLGCPDWSPETVIRRAAEFGYNGIEWRGGPSGHVRPSLPAVERRRLREHVAESGLFSLAITAYTSFTSHDANERRGNLEELSQYLDLAAELGATYVRAFLGRLPPGRDLSEVHANIVESLMVALDHAQSAGVQIAVEPHDDFVRSSSVEPILSQVPHPSVKVVWDVGNAFSAGEEPEEGFQRLGSRLAYLHVKDGVGRLPSWRLTRLGEGEVPLERTFALLLENNFAASLCVEWERAWHPELDPPELALPHALKVTQALLDEARAKG